MGFDLHGVDGFLQKIFREVGKSDGFDLAFLISLLNVFISLAPVICRLVEEKKVDIIRIQTSQSFVTRKISSLATPLFFIPLPVSDSFIYPLAVSIRRTPLFKALSTDAFVSLFCIDCT